MIRRAISALALTAVLAAPAVAQAPFQQTFTFHNFGSDTEYDQYAGQWSSSYNAANSVFQVFCVDPGKNVGQNETYTNAWVTPLSSGNSSHTQNYTNTWNAQYLEAARIATFMFANPVVGSGLSNAAVLDYQHAIWAAMGFAAYQNATTAAIRASAAAIVVYPNQWLVITDVNKGRQEFITFDPDRPQETVPEPATMTLLATGLAGMAAAKRRRNKKS